MRSTTYLVGRNIAANPKLVVAVGPDTQLKACSGLTDRSLADGLRILRNLIDTNLIFLIRESLYKLKGPE
jgi:hypothetical protein